MPLGLLLQALYKRLVDLGHNQAIKAGKWVYFKGLFGYKLVKSDCSYKTWPELLTDLKRTLPSLFYLAVLTCFSCNP